MKSLNVALASATSDKGVTLYWLELIGKGPITRTYPTERQAVAIVSALRTKRDFNVTETVKRDWRSRPLA